MKIKNKLEKWEQEGDDYACLRRRMEKYRDVEVKPSVLWANYIMVWCGAGSICTLPALFLGPGILLGITINAGCIVAVLRLFQIRGNVFVGVLAWLSVTSLACFALEWILGIPIFIQFMLYLAAFICSWEYLDRQ